MSSQDNQFVALGPADIGFKTHATRITSGAEIHGTLVGVVGRCQGRDGDGVAGFGSGTTGAGVHGMSNVQDGNGITADAHNGSQAFALWARSRSGLAGRFDGAVRINGALTVTGAKSSAVPLADGTLRLLYAVESPESWFEDFGSGRLDNGVAEIALDETFQAVTGNDEYHVFLTEYEDNNALYVSNRTGSGFTVPSKTPSAGGEFSYRIVAKRGDIDSARFAEESAMDKPVGDDYKSAPPEAPEAP
ncbi:hypothetical protein ACFV7Q_09770 [Streptomyces sp. NPDC059851]|uniref:hypothetical protein n=1 Tax=Streptomyces sp. NPDC059851 TaxID=3346971 RepID=UPI0036593C04